MTRQTDSAVSRMNSATSSAADPVTTNTVQQTADAVAFSIAPASRWASCRSHNQSIQAARCVAKGARRDRTIPPLGPEIAASVVDLTRIDPPGELFAALNVLEGTIIGRCMQRR
jgi:hypothetical protein